ncbi:zonular occludens toxin domain-containing protein [Pelomonas cellulosilytica]|uniref:Zonular occludens toxin domain-containing protein n=1 Tax=Pelomonas cellulosilytica TaxID=2906762 RepID=A0ABS8XTF3_9BURK|nr:zonular occludens toxin domain-containing protein [Pelomonas sp. P8]MCE4555007.1 zonular occludens toxin domain-containing protein [Pelomonas sp. P8]
MIIFHEGLPGSGKSYEAMVTRIIPALAKGREVVAYVEGLDYTRIAELAGIEESRCRELLFSLTREQVESDWLAHMRPNALHVLDEAQNFWGNRRKFTPAETKMVTEHRHEGMDIVLMGQDLRDVHATWRRRVELKICFLKLNGFGKLFAKRYSCTTYRHMGGDDFRRVGLQVRVYDARYFGTYKSHVSDETNTDDYTDSRAQVFSHPLLKYGVPAVVVAGVWGGVYTWRFFHPAAAAPSVAVSASLVGPRVPSPAASVAPVPRVAAPVPSPVTEKPEQSPIERRMVDLASKGRIRLAGLASMRDHTTGIVEWVQGGTVVVERLTLDALRTLGVGVVVSGDVVQLAVGDYRELATPWPLEDMGRVSEARQDTIRPAVRLSSAAPVPPDLSTAAQPRDIDLPGPLTRAPQREPFAGSLQRRIAQVAQ